jgi:polysaccharide biosynthesis protein PslH
VHNHKNVFWGGNLKVLWAKSELLHPVDKGGKIRTLEMLKELKRAHHVTYVCLGNPADTDETRAQASEYCHELITVPWSEPPRFSAGFYLDLVKNVFSGLPYVIQKYRSQAMYDYVATQDAQGAFDVIVCDFLTPSANIPVQPRSASVLFEHNVETILWERTYKNEKQWAKRAYFFGQYLKMRAYESMLCHRYDAVAAVSTNDAADIERMFGVPKVFAIPTGVDVNFFAPADAVDPARPFMQMPRVPRNLVFTGSMDWMPNEDAIVYFAGEILPKIVARIPEVTVTVVGRNPTPKLQALARSEPRIELTGRVEDVRPYIDRGDVYIVPIRVGGGTRIKIYEAMGMAKAVVSTSIGAEGLPLADGKEIILADDAQAFADQVIRLLEQVDARAAIESAARRAVVERFGWARATGALVEAMEFAISKHQQTKIS